MSFFLDISLVKKIVIARFSFFPNVLLWGRFMLSYLSSLINVNFHYMKHELKQDILAILTKYLNFWASFTTDATNTAAPVCTCWIFVFAWIFPNQLQRNRQGTNNLYHLQREELDSRDTMAYRHFFIRCPFFNCLYFETHKCTAYSICK